MLLATVASGLMMAILSSSIVNIALPGIAADFQTNFSTAMWVASIYMIVQATFMPVMGRAGDLYGHRNVYVFGLLMFTAMSILCTFAWNIESLIAGRALMALGTSALSPMALSFVMDAFPGRERGPALGIMGGLMGAAPTVGTVSGGFLVGAFGWRSVFLVAVPLCAVILPLAMVVLKGHEARDGERGFDVPGGLLLTVGLFAGLLSVSQGRFWGWTDQRTIAGFAVLVLFLVFFIVWESRARRPMIDLSLFRYRSLVSANVAGMFASAAMFGTFVLLPFFFQRLVGDSPQVTGLKIAPLALMFLIIAPIGGRLTNTLGARTTPQIGLVIAAAGFLLISRVIADDVSTLLICVAIAVLGIGLGMTNAPLTTAALHDVPRDKRGVASSLPQMGRFIGSSFGIAVTGAFLSSRVAARLAEMGVPAAEASAIATASENGTISAQYHEAFNGAFQDVFVFALVLVAAAFIIATLVPQLREAGDKP
ncbi:MAG: DHA2 family efflux MFS transporter permease subunit [Gaiellales bacterium]|nr:MAG: DHA2 family efflux MFS transporter permease subunit [Gaiellales bacterium]